MSHQIRSELPNLVATIFRLNLTVSLTSSGSYSQAAIKFIKMAFYGAERKMIYLENNIRNAGIDTVQISVVRSL